MGLQALEQCLLIHLKQGVEMGGAQMEYVGVLYSEQRAGRESSVSELYAWISNALTHSLTVDLSPLQHV